MSENVRPGVYTSYEVTSTLAAAGSGGAVGIAARTAAGAAGQVHAITDYAAAADAFGADCPMTRLVRVLLQNGAPKILAVSAGDTGGEADYAAAFAALMRESAVRYMICDTRDPAAHALLLSAIAGAESENCKYRIGLAEGAGTVQELVSAAAALNSERMVLVAPGEAEGTPGAAAAALAGTVAAASDPALPLNGAVLTGLSALGDSYTDGEINTLAAGGVTPLETVGSETSVIRAVTTRTRTAGEPDSTFRELSTILIVDSVIPDVRAALKTRFARTKNTAQTRGAIRTRVVVELERKLAAEIIESYGDVTAEPSPDDPTVCLVRFGFTVAHGLNRISLVAAITV